MNQKITIINIIIWTFIFIPTWTFAQTDFSRTAVSIDSTYGYTDTNPLRMKIGNVGKSIGYSYDFLHGLTTHDDQKLKFVQRTTVDNPNYKRSRTQLTNPDTEMSLRPKGSELDRYIFFTSKEKDTVTIYVDVYRKGTLKIPIGLKFK
ncbi:MAG: hypothetical protein WEB30_06020 [Cyclobacteriaceae bacterium]